MSDPYFIDVDSLPVPILPSWVKGQPPRAAVVYNAKDALATSKTIVADYASRLAGARSPDILKMVEWTDAKRGELLPELVARETARAQASKPGRAKELKHRSRQVYDILLSYFKRGRPAEPQAIEALMYALGLADTVERRNAAELMIQLEVKGIARGERLTNDELAAKVRKTVKWIQILRRQRGVQDRAQRMTRFFSAPGVVERNDQLLNEELTAFVDEFHAAVPSEWSTFDETTARRAIAGCYETSASIRRTSRIVIFRMTQREASEGRAPSSVMMHAVFRALRIRAIKEPEV